MPTASPRRPRPALDRRRIPAALRHGASPGRCRHPRAPPGGGRTCPPCSAQIASARSIGASTGWSADSKPSTSSACRPSPASVTRASRASIRRQFAGFSPDCATARTHSAPRAKLGEAHGRRAAVDGSRLHAHPRLGDDSQHALRAGEHPVGAGPGARAGQAARLPRARRCDRADRLDEVLDVRPHGREVPGRARRDPPAEGGELEGLREVAQRQAVLGELALQRRAGGARLDARGAGDGVHLHHPVQRAHVERDGAVVGGGDLGPHSPHHARAAAVGDRGHALRRAPLQHLLHLALRAGAGDEVGGVREVPPEAAHDVGVRAAPRVHRARVGVGGADLRERRRRHNARRRQARLLQRHRLLHLERPLPPEVRREAAGRGAHLLGGHLLVLVPPPPVAASALRHGGESRGHGARPCRNRRHGRWARRPSAHPAWTERVAARTITPPGHTSVTPPARRAH